jgi:hypothetical protein
MLHRAIGVEHRIRTQIDGRIEEFDNQSAERIRLGEARNLVSEFEVFEDFLDVRREAVEIGFEIRF